MSAGRAGHAGRALAPPAAPRQSMPMGWWLFWERSSKLPDELGLEWNGKASARLHVELEGLLFRPFNPAAWPARVLRASARCGRHCC